jgi:hypothetical protein
LHDDRRILIRSRIRIYTSDRWIRIREAQKHVDPVDPYPEHCVKGSEKLLKDLENYQRIYRKY